MDDKSDMICHQRDPADFYMRETGASEARGEQVPLGEGGLGYCSWTLFRSVPQNPKWRMRKSRAREGVRFQKYRF